MVCGRNRHLDVNTEKQSIDNGDVRLTLEQSLCDSNMTFVIYSLTALTEQDKTLLYDENDVKGIDCVVSASYEPTGEAISYSMSAFPEQDTPDQRFSALSTSAYTGTVTRDSKTQSATVVYRGVTCVLTDGSSAVTRDGKRVDGQYAGWRLRSLATPCMEVIMMGPGDAIVPNNLTEQLLRGGMNDAATGTNYWPGATAGTNGALDNLRTGTNGKYYNWTSAGNKSGKSSKKTSGDDTWKQAAEDEIAALKYKLHMELITQRQYYDGLTAINDKYYRNRADYLEEEHKLNEELFDLQRDLFDD